MDIFLWGPSGSGKTWLLKALIHQINLIEDSLNTEHPLFDIWIEDIKGHRVTCSSLKQEATSDIDYVTYKLHRKFDYGQKFKTSFKYKNKSKRLNENTQYACTHDHQIAMLDGPGDVVTGRILNYADNEENRAKVKSAQTRLKSAKYLIVLVNGGNNQNTQNNNTPQTNSGKEFSESIQRLINLDRDNNQKVYICFPKIDQNQGTAATVDSMLLLLFGKNAKIVESKIRDLLNMHQGKIPAYFISAPGYHYDSEGNLKANFNVSNGILEDEYAWQPHNVCKLFFDIFDDGEKEAVNKQIFDPPIPPSIPIPKKMKNYINEKLLDAKRKDIADSYISYHDMLDFVDP